METAFTLFTQVIIMFILTIVGYLLFRYGKISQEGSKSLGNILIFVSLPCVIINSFLVEFSSEKLFQLLASTVVCFVVMFVGAVISRLGCLKNGINAFSGTFSNPGFFGVPLIAAAFNSDAVFYIAPFIAFVNLGQWTYGVSLLESSDKNGDFIINKDKKKEPLGTAIINLLKRLMKAPFMIAILIGLFFFLSHIPMPTVASKCIGFLAGLNTPIAMFTIGIYLAQTDIRKTFFKARLYWVSFIRLILVPIISLLILSLLPASMLELKICVLIAAASPVGSNVAVYAQLYDSDYTYAVETVIVSTLLSVVTIPLIIAAASMLWHFS